MMLIQYLQTINVTVLSHSALSQGGERGFGDGVMSRLSIPRSLRFAMRGCGVLCFFWIPAYAGI